MSLFLRFPSESPHVPGTPESSFRLDINSPVDLNRIPLITLLRSLAREQRFGNLLGEGIAYNVLQHSLFVTRIVQEIFKGSRNAVIGAMIHDLHEAVGLRDLPSPIKNAMRDEGDGAYDALCEFVDTVFAARFGYKYNDIDAALIKKADKFACAVEQFVLQGVEENWPTESADVLQFATAAEMLGQIGTASTGLTAQEQASGMVFAYESYFSQSAATETITLSKADMGLLSRILGLDVNSESDLGYDVYDDEEDLDEAREFKFTS